MNKWQELPISELGDVYTGRTPPSKNPEFFGNEYPFITPSDMDGRKFISVTDRYLSHSGAVLLNRIMVPANSVCVSCIGWQMGKAVMTSRPSFTNQQINTIVPNDKILPGFLYYSLLPRKEELLSLGAAIGVRTPISNKSNFSALTVKVPSKTLQYTITAVLSAYDDLIENNSRRITILEEMAQTLYREWFVHFRFPGHESVEFVEVDGENGRLPAGWEIRKIVEVCDRITSGGTPRTKEPSYWNGGIPWLSSGETRQKFIIDTERTITTQGIENSSTKLAKAGTVVVAGAGQGHTRGQVSLLMLDSYVNQSVLNLSASLVSNYYLFFNLSDRYNELRLASDSFSSRGSLTTKLIGSLPIVVPTRSSLDLFDKMIEPMVSLVVSLQRKNTCLRQTRDLLLPRLISGELDLSTLEIDIPS